MTTLRRELRLKFKQVLEENGIYTEAIPPMPSIVDLLADAALGVAGISAAQASKRFGVAAVGRHSQDMALKRLALAERIEAQLVNVDHNKQAWVRVLNKIVEAEENGDSFDRYVQWYKAGNDYNRPKTFQIAKNPSLIWGNWKEAQAFTAETTKAPYEIT